MHLCRATVGKIEEPEEKAMAKVALLNAGIVVHAMYGSVIAPFQVSIPSLSVFRLKSAWCHCWLYYIVAI